MTLTPSAFGTSPKSDKKNLDADSKAGVGFGGGEIIGANLREGT